MEATIQQYKDAQAKLAGLQTQHEARCKSAREAHRSVTRKLGDRIWALQAEIGEAEQDHKEAEKNLDQVYREARTPYEDTVGQIKRMLTLMDLARRHPEPVAMGSVFTYSNTYPRERIILTPFDILAADEHKQIGAWIIPNRKPKNCFTLAVIGWSRFGHNASLGLRQSVFLDYCNEKPYANVGGAIRSAPTEAELRAYYTKVRPTLLRDYLAKHAALEAQYQEALELLGDPAWLRFYLDDQKDYYEHRYSGGTEKPEYQVVLQELAAIA